MAARDLRIAGRPDRFLTFRSAGRIYAVPAGSVREIVLPQQLAKVPLSPKPLLGLANLRGAVLPVASLNLLLGRAGVERQSGRERVIVLDGRPGFGVLVDDVVSLTSGAAADANDAQALLSADDGEIVTGAFRFDGPDGVARILDMQALLSRAFGAIARRDAPAPVTFQRREGRSEDAVRQTETFITFVVSGQEFALPLVSVQEVLPSADAGSPLPRTESAVLGLTALRNTLLPLLSMQALLGFAVDGAKRMTLVANVSGVAVGLAVDAVRDIVTVEPDELEPVPAAIAGRSQGETAIQSVLKLNDGRRLIAILSPDRLFREDVMTKIRAASTTRSTAALAGANVVERTFLVFSLGDQEFGLDISAVEEVARVPGDISRLPKSPDFLRGVINLRGTVLPIVDQRRRFDLPAASDDGGRLVVVRIGSTLAGFIVDSVSEVMRIAETAVAPPPDVIVATHVLEGVINLEDAGRMVLLLDPSQLLSRTEQGLLDALGKVQEAQAELDQGPHR